MNTDYFEKIKKIDSKVEFVAIALSLIGLLLFFVDNEVFKFFLVPGCLILILLYVLRFYTPDRLENVSSAMETFIDKVVHGALAAAVTGIMLIFLGKEGIIFLIVGIFSTLIFLFTMVYNKIKLESKYVWGQRYFLRIILIIGFTFLLFLKVKGYITFEI